MQNQNQGRKFGMELTNTDSSSNSLGTRKQVKPLIVSVEAAIGTGKSTLLRLMQQKEPTWVFVQEPVDKWQDIGGEGHNLLAAFYGDLERYGFSFTSHCVLSRIEAVTQALATCPSDTPVIVVERSWLSDRHTFAEMLHQSGKLSDMEWAMYQQWYQFAVKTAPKLDGHMYLECQTETCMNRLKKRCRSAEVGVTAEYQTSLIEITEKWLATCDQSKIVKVNVDTDYADDAEQLAFASRMVESVRQFTTQLIDARSH